MLTRHALPGDDSKSPNSLASMRPVMNTGARGHSRLRAIILVAIGLVLTWLVVSRSLAAFFANAAPHAAMWFDSGQPEALVNIADQALAVARSTEVPAQATEEHS